MKKILIGLVAALVLSLSAFAGLDTYTSKNYVTLLAPQGLIASIAVTNSTVDGVRIAGLPGKGAITFAYVANNAPDAVVSFRLWSCATTNGTYVAYTNIDGVSTFPYTNGAAFVTIPFTPNRAAAYMRCVATPSASVTSGVAAAILNCN